MMAFIAAESREFSGLERLSRPLDYALILAANGPGPVPLALGRSVDLFRANRDA